MRARPAPFESGGMRLAGELFTPEASGPHPAVVLLHGAGMGTRDYLGPYVEAFVAAGLAAFVFDRRGEGESEGSPRQDIFTFAEDAVAAWRCATGLPEVDSRRVGLWGYSNGAWVAAHAAPSLPECAFLALTGASAVTPAEAEAYRRTAELEGQGIGPASLRAVHRTWELVFGFLARGEWQDGWNEELSTLRGVIDGDVKLQSLPVSELARRNPALDAVPRFDSPMFEGLKDMGGSTPWFGYDPIPDLERTTLPVLVVLAEQDKNLPPIESARRFAEAAAARDGGAEFRIEVLAGADHSFSRENASANDEVEWLTRPRRLDEFREGYLELMAVWMMGHSG
ncbi:MAG: alpha/beta hydrolase [Dehalococcoidia bacterium]